MKSGNAVCETGCICCWALLINIERPHGSPVEENEMKPRRPLLRIIVLMYVVLGRVARETAMDVWMDVYAWMDTLMGEKKLGRT